MATFRIKGLDQIQRQLERLQKNAEKLHGTHHIPMNELFPPSFMRRYSSYATFQEMYDASPFNNMDFEKIPDADWGEYVCRSTKFTSWEKMRGAATEEWAKARLMNGAEGFSDYVTIKTK
jgi:hypothetical protein